MGRERSPLWKLRIENSAAGDRPGGSAAHWRPWCLLELSCRPAGEAGPGNKKAHSSAGAGRRVCERATSPGRSPGADEIEIQVREIEVAVHANIIGDSSDSVNRLIRNCRSALDIVFAIP